ncbi:hypothetical protein ScalyP_jg7407 [Parmales sp. scaly parma]|nr:hypothetical protein ScalyP_jg7407 [Parmales sp. scaly parma]|tara:strand:- start:434 stop:1399 length:966 start_codon:yes stop_codon:yes gene_type:complete
MLRSGVCSSSVLACPLSYRYSPAAILNNKDRPASSVTYVAGGLYGNSFALDAIENLQKREQHIVELIFNGDFNFFNMREDKFSFDKYNDRFRNNANITCTRGNIEAEIISDTFGGCGCAYPYYVSSDIKLNADLIVSRLHSIAQKRCSVENRNWLSNLPNFVTLKFANGERVGILHGDATSLSGWDFAEENIESNRDYIEQAFEESNVSGFCTTHTCQAFGQKFKNGFIWNNGAAGIPNFSDGRYGLLTRISLEGVENPHEALYECTHKGINYSAVKIMYDEDSFHREFTSLHGEGTPAHASYFGRISCGVSWRIDQADRL